MIDQEQIEKLLVEWEDSREKGVPLSVEELCRDCPEYVIQLRPQIAALEEIYGRLFPETMVPGETLPSATDSSFISPPESRDSSLVPEARPRAEPRAPRSRHRRRPSTGAATPGRSGPRRSRRYRASPLHGWRAAPCRSFLRHSGGLPQRPTSRY